MEDFPTFDQYWRECLRIAATTRQKEIMVATSNLYHEAWEERLSPEEIMSAEWGG